MHLLVHVLSNPFGHSSTKRRETKWSTVSINTPISVWRFFLKKTAAIQSNEITSNRTLINAATFSNPYRNVTWIIQLDIIDMRYATIDRREIQLSNAPTVDRRKSIKRRQSAAAAAPKDSQQPWNRTKKKPTETTSNEENKKKNKQKKKIKLKHKNRIEWLFCFFRCRWLAGFVYDRHQHIRIRLTCTHRIHQLPSFMLVRARSQSNNKTYVRSPPVCLVWLSWVHSVDVQPPAFSRHIQVQVCGVANKRVDLLRMKRAQWRGQVSASKSETTD